MTAMKRGILGGFVIGLFTAAVAPRIVAQPYLVRDGQPQAQIVIAKRATRMQTLAAEQLRAYIAKISGAELPIVLTPIEAYPVRIYVGRSKYTDELGLKNDDLNFGAYRIKTGPDWLVLLGKDTDYFMDQPGDGGAVYVGHRSQQKKAAEAWQKLHGPQWSPPFLSSFKGYNKELGVWLVDEYGSLNAVNDFLRSLGVRWYMPGDFGEICPQMQSIPVPEIDETIRPEWSQREIHFHSANPYQISGIEMLWQLRLGLRPQRESLGGHGTAFLLKPEWVKENYPKYYALYGGERATRGQGKPCYSSEGLFQSALGFSRLMFDEYGKDIVSLMPTDGYTAFCQCELCRGKDTPERGFKAMMSDYVWSFMNRAAAEIAKTHPDKDIMCYAYNTYRDPPRGIERFHPNLRVGICGSRKSFHDPEKKEMYLNIRQGFLDRLPSGKISLWEYYNVALGMPDYFPHTIAEDLKRLKGHIDGTMIEFTRGKRISDTDPAPDTKLASSHLNLWLTARLWWNPDARELWWNKGRDVDALLEEYYTNFYGPAAAEMKTFILFCEANSPRMRISPAPIDQAFELIARARKVAGEDNIYARRIQLVVDYMQALKPIRENLAVGRKNNPVAMFVERDGSAIELDGKLNDEFWQEATSYNLGDTETGEALPNKTTFKMAWAGDSLYLAIRCEEENMDGLVVPAMKDGDNTIFDGDSIELELETASHAYYQISIDPKGHVNDLDRPDASMIGKTGPYNTKWEAGIEVATYRGKDFWNIEVRIPALGEGQEEVLPDYGVSGDKPSADKPWYFNVCRIRKAGGNLQLSAFSPTGERGFHYRRKFARLIPAGSSGPER